MTNIFGTSRDRRGKRPRVFIKTDAAHMSAMYQVPLSKASELLILARTIQIKFPRCTSLDCRALEKLLKYYPTGVDYAYLLPPIVNLQNEIMRIITSLSPDDLQTLTEELSDKKLSVKTPELYEHLTALIDMLNNMLSENFFSEDLRHRVQQQRILLMLGLGYDACVITEALSAAC